MLTNVVRSQAQTLRSSGYSISEEQIQDAIKRLQVQFTTKMELGTMFETKDRIPWLDNAQTRIDPYYWNRYTSHLRRRGRSKEIVSKLDSITHEILDRLEDPEKPGPWSKRGLVVGNVQSGKTENFTGLINKAADAGYKVIIVLAGTLNSLRSQTQGRIDSDFVGKCTKTHDRIGVGLVDRSRTPASLTSVLKDFGAAIVANSGISLQALKEPIVFVIKKNATTLKNLREWFESNNQDGLKAYPMLLIDDEADYASINTRAQGEDPATINLRIRELLALFPRNSFVGYTATPFANIFIDPESEHEMTDGELYRDLFPKDFILALDPPNNYVGATKIFGKDAKLNCLREICDNEDYLPLKHKITFIPEALPPSLEQAIDSFIVAKAIRLTRCQIDRHHSMMINASRFTNVQNRLRDLVQEAVKKRVTAIRSYAGLPEEKAIKNPDIRRLRELFLSDFAESDANWPEIQSRLLESAAPIKVISVNLKGESTIDYSPTNYPRGRSVIAIGGLSLSRGLTLEGLITTYFLRNSMMYDTLLQMGRWFGYRDGYADICRIFMQKEAISWYGHISDAVEELREQFESMRRADLTPVEFGLRVRSHPTSLIVTARNKMRSASDHIVSIQLDGCLAETSVLFSDTNYLKINSGAIEGLIKQAIKLKEPERLNRGYLWRGLPVDLAIGMLKEFKNHPESILTNVEPLHERLEGIRDIDVVLCTKQGTSESAQPQEYFGGFPIIRFNREFEYLDHRKIVFNHRRVGSPSDEEIGLPKEALDKLKAAYRTSDSKKSVPPSQYRKLRHELGMPPLLIIRPVIVKKEGCNPVSAVAFGISFPGDLGAARRPEYLVKYKVTARWLAQNCQADPGDEDEAEEEAS
jgi:hypothetical protein